MEQKRPIQLTSLNWGGGGGVGTDVPFILSKIEAISGKKNTTKLLFVSVSTFILFILPRTGTRKRKLIFTITPTKTTS